MKEVMTKRRTRKQKEKAKHTFTISWDGGYKERSADSSVKRQLARPSRQSPSKIAEDEKAKLLVKDVNLASTKKDIIKSLILAGFILASEVVLYLVWKV